MVRDPDIRCSPEEGRAYRAGIYRPVDTESLPDAPRTSDFPDPGSGPPYHRMDDIPRVPRLRHVVGPSVIALGVGLGAGFVATLVSFFWPGWAAESADFTRNSVNALAGRVVLPDWQPLALVMLVSIWCALAISRVVYNALEKFEIALVIVFLPLLFLALVAAGVLPGDLSELARGATSVGRAPQALLSGGQFPTLLIAVASRRLGGTLLLAQSLWIRDKGFGMAAYQGRIAGIRGENEPVSERGFAFSTVDPIARARFRRWMALAERELLVTFVILILFSVVITTLLVAETVGTGRRTWPVT